MYTFLGSRFNYDAGRHCGGRLQGEPGALYMMCTKLLWWLTIDWV